MTTTMIIARRRRFARPRMALLVLSATLAVQACDILDVDNPNNLLEEDVQKPAAAAAIASGALSTVARAISRGWQPVGMAADELNWIGSRDAWGQLDFGFLSDPSNEFTDENFPYLGEARWMAAEAEEIILGHVAEAPTDELNAALAQAHLYAGLMYMVLGETQEDFAFSDKTEPAPPIGPENMYTVLDEAIVKISNAIALAQEVGDSELETRALALRARARHSRAIWDKIKPNVSTDPLVDADDAAADAQAVLDRVGDDWTYKLSYSAETVDNNMADWINDRGENQIDTLSVVNVDQKNVREIVSVRLKDPVDDVADPVITAKLVEWKGGDITGTGNVFPPLTVTSARHMHLILAEDALQRGDDAGFQTHINHVRSMDGLTDYSGQIPALEMLEHERRVNLFLMGLRLNDMYRFGTHDPHWQPNSDAAQRPGTLMPISTIECRSNPELSDSPRCP